MHAARARAPSRHSRGRSPFSRLPFTTFPDTAAMRRFRILVPLLVLFACKGGDSTGPDVPVRVQVVPAQQTLTWVGATQQFPAQAVNDTGDPISSAGVTWRSS